MNLLSVTEVLKLVLGRVMCSLLLVKLLVEVNGLEVEFCLVLGHHRLHVLLIQIDDLKNMLLVLIFFLIHLILVVLVDLFDLGLLLQDLRLLLGSHIF